MGRCVLNPFTINHHLLGIKESSRNKDTGTNGWNIEASKWMVENQIGIFYWIHTSYPKLGERHSRFIYPFTTTRSWWRSIHIFLFRCYCNCLSPSSYHLSLELLHQDYIPPISFINNRLLKSISDMSQIMSLNCLILSMTLHSLQQEIQISWKGI